MFLATAILCGLVFSPTPTEGTLITIEIEAVVDSVWDEANYLEGGISPGDTITGTYTYDLLTADSEPLGYGGLYEHDNPPAGISLHGGGFDFRTDPDNVDFVVAILNDYPPFAKDQVWMTSYNNLPLSNGLAVDSISWQLDDPSATALDSTALPGGPLILDDWLLNPLLIHGPSRGACFGISAHVISAIPEPCTILLLGAGVLFLRKGS